MMVPSAVLAAGGSSIVSGAMLLAHKQNLSWLRAAAPGGGNGV